MNMEHDSFSSAFDKVQRGEALSIVAVQDQQRNVKSAQVNLPADVARVAKSRDELAKREAAITKQENELHQLAASWEQKVRNIETEEGRLRRANAKHDGFMTELARQRILANEVWGEDEQWDVRGHPSFLAGIYAQVQSLEALIADFPRWQSEQEASISRLKGELEKFRQANGITPGSSN
jgi:hypothetical protein